MPMNIIELIFRKTKRLILRTVCVAEQRKFLISSTVAKPSGTRLPRCLRNCVKTDALSCN